MILAFFPLCVTVPLVSLLHHIVHVLALSSRLDVLKNVDAPSIVAGVKEHLPGRDLSEKDLVSNFVGSDNASTDPESSVTSIPRLALPDPHRAGPDPTPGLPIDPDHAPKSLTIILTHFRPLVEGRRATAHKKVRSPTASDLKERERFYAFLPTATLAACHTRVVHSEHHLQS